MTWICPVFSTPRDLSEKRRHGHVSQEVWDKVIDALARRGVELLSEGTGHGAGVRWMRRRTDRAS